jgi:opine dehydrogenase
MIAGIPLPLHQAGIALFNAICARDFRTENDLLPLLNLQALDIDALRRQFQ